MSKIIPLIIICLFIFWRANRSCFKEIKNSLKIEYMITAAKIGIIDINKQNPHGRTTLMLACNKNSIKDVKALLKRKANPNLEDNFGYTALFFAASSNIEIVKEIIAYKGDINHKSKQGYTALNIAITYNKKYILTYLLDHGINPNIKNKYGMTPLFYVNDLSIAKILIKHGADINILDNCLNSILITWLSDNEIKIDQVILLIEKGINLNIKNHRGKTALMIAQKKKYTDIVKLLKEAGAKE